MPPTSAFQASYLPRLAVTGAIAVILGVACAAPAAEPKAPAQTSPPATGPTTAAPATPPVIAKQVTSPSPVAAPQSASPNPAPKAAVPSPSPVAKTASPSPAAKLASPSPATKATGPTPTPGPAPSQDRVGFPENYQTTYQPFYVFDRPDNQQVRAIYANDPAASVQPGQDFPYGSILVMETWSTKKDASGAVQTDADGRYVRDQLNAIFVMRKEPGFGTDYQNQRTGEWEYVAFRPDGSYQTPPERSNSCATCHLQATEAKDWVFRTNLHFDPNLPQVPQPLGPQEVNIDFYAYAPAKLTARAGTTVTWVNNDVIEHTATATDGSFDTGRIKAGASASQTLTTPGTIDYLCTIHQGMKAQVEVTG